MRYSLNFLVLSIILTAPVAGLAQSRTYSNVGRTPTEEEIRNLGIIVGPEGKELPPGRGTAKEVAGRSRTQRSVVARRDPPM